MMLSLADPTKYYQLLLSQGIGVGIGSGLLLVPALSIQSHHWRRRRSLVMGIVLCGRTVLHFLSYRYAHFFLIGSSCGGIVYPIMLNQLFHNGVGFSWGVRAAAFMTLGLLSIANLILRTRLPDARQRRKAAAEKAVPTAHMRDILTDVPFLWMNAGGFLGLWGVFLPCTSAISTHRRSGV